MVELGKSHSRNSVNNLGQPQSLDQPLERQGFYVQVTHMDTSGQWRMCQECVYMPICVLIIPPNIFHVLCSVSWLVETQVDELE